MILFARAWYNDHGFFKWVFGIISLIQLGGVIVSVIYAPSHFRAIRAMWNQLGDAFDNHAQEDDKPFDRYKTNDRA